MATLGSRWAKRLTCLLLAGVLLLGLSGCGAQGPETKLVKRAIALEFEQTQVALSQQLRNPLPQFKIQRLAIDQQRPFPIQGLAGFRVQGHYDVVVTFPDQRYRQTDNAFDVYLQQQTEDGEIWRLAVPVLSEDGSQTWQTYLLFDPLQEPA